MKSRFGTFFFAVGLALAQRGTAQQPTELVQRALQNRGVVKASEKILEAAKRTSSSLGAPPLTRLEVGSGTNPDVNGGEDFTLFQPLDLFGKARASRSGGRAGIMMAESAFRQTKIDVQTEVLTGLATYANATRNLQTAKDQLAIILAVERATIARVAARSLPELQSTRASIEVQRAGQVVVDREANVRAAAVKLQQVVGDQTSAISLVVTQIISINPSNPNRDRPELLLLASQRNGFIADQRVAKLGQLPDFELQARRSPWATAEQYGVRFQIVVPLWDHGSSRNKASAAQMQADATSLQLSDALKRISAEIEAARIQLDAAKKSLAAYTTLLVDVKELMEKTQRGFELGASTLIDVFDAKRALADAMEQRSTAQLNLDLATAELLRAQGQILGEEKR